MSAPFEGMNIEHRQKKIAILLEYFLNHYENLQPLKTVNNRMSNDNDSFSL